MAVVWETNRSGSFSEKSTFSSKTIQFLGNLSFGRWNLVPSSSWVAKLTSRALWWEFCGFLRELCYFGGWIPMPVSPKSVEVEYSTPLTSEWAPPPFPGPSLSNLLNFAKDFDFFFFQVEKPSEKKSRVPNRSMTGGRTDWTNGRKSSRIFSTKSRKMSNPFWQTCDADKDSQVIVSVFL